MHASSRVLAFGVLAFVGAGCLGGGGASGADGGFYLSTDGANTWTQSVALPSATSVGSIAGANILSLEIDPSDTTAYYLGTESNGLLYSYDAGATWLRPEEELLRDGRVLAVEVDPRDVCTYYVMKRDRIVKTTDCGRTFDGAVYVESREDESLTAMVLDWYNADVLYATTSAGDVLRSENAGETWSTVYRVKDEIVAFAVSNADSRVLLVGTHRHGLHRSTDSGATWTEFEDTLKDEYKDSDKVLAFAQTAAGDALYMSSEFGILVSKDNGETWDDLALIPASGEVEITALAVDPADGNNVYFGTATTLYRSTDGGANWMTDELPSSRAASVLAVDPNDSERILLGVRALED